MSDKLGSDVLHVYAQAEPHDDAFISGGRPALMRLRDAIGVALEKDIGQCDAFTADGEGYRLHIVAMSYADAVRQIPPYPAVWLSTQGFGPWEIIMDQPK